MIRFLPVAVALVAVVRLAAPDTRAAETSAPLSYNEHVLPIFAENCFHCHGPDSGTRKGKLRLDRAADATSVRGDHDPAIIPGKPKESMLVERILSTDDDERMPPADSHKKLSAVEIALLQRWISEGAVYEDHWSFQVPVRPAVPTIARPVAWTKNPIDGFVAETLASAKLKPAAEENSARLLRRVAFDVTGLAPTPAEIAAFAADKSPGAYERAVDRMLGSDASAEHFARRWLDAVRYADTHGIHIDNYRSIWPYRDWVIGAFRRNLPFDRFTVEQIAGDLLPDATLEQKIASGYNRCLPTTSEGGAIPEEYEAIYAKDQVETLSTVWLGLTTGCAACHDHKFDPISQKDFYAMSAFFRNSTMPVMDGNRHDTPPTLWVPAVADRSRAAALEKLIAGTNAELTVRRKDAENEYEQWRSAVCSLTPPPADHTVRLHVPLNETDGPIVLPTIARMKSVASSANTASTSPTTPDRITGIFGPAPRLNDLDLVVGASPTWTSDMADSYSLFVRVNGAPCGTLLSCLADTPGASGWELFFDGGKLGLRITSGNGAVNVRNIAGAVLAPDRWHHVLLTFDTASSRSRLIDVFVDGRSAINGGSAFLPVDILPSSPLRLGSRQAASGGPTLGLSGGNVWVQDFRAFNRGFFPPDVKVLFDLLDAHAALTAPPASRSVTRENLLRTHYFSAVDQPSRALGAKLDGYLAEQAAIQQRGGLTLVMEEKKDSEPFAHILSRGEYTLKREKVLAATPAALPPLPSELPRNRLALARWLVAPENPLTARVTVNRLWQDFFGTGLVESAGDFGVMGSRPSHPRLLDWLAVEFRESGWDHRHLVRLIVTSATYRQSAAISPALLERDPANRLLARGPRHRLEAEQLRDQALAASGLLVAKLGGRSVRPYQPEGIWEEVAMKESTTRFYRPDSGENLYRRSLYTMWKRTAAPPAMEILNAPSREVSCVRRDRTNTPLQALVTMNEPLFVEASRELASRALRSSADVDARLETIAWPLLGRAFVPAERTVLRQTLDAALATYRRSPELARELLHVGASAPDAKLPAAELAAWTVVASQVMNLDEALTK